MMPEFQRVLVADLSSELDLGLIGFGAHIAAESSAGSLLAFTPAAARFLPVFSPIIDRIYNCLTLPAPSYRVLPASESAAGFAEEFRADLMLARYSGADKRSREFYRRLIWEAPCSVWLFPWEQNTSAEPLICPAPELSWLGYALRRDDTEHRLSLNRPLLSVRAQRRSVGVRQILRDLFALEEPQFN
jgi:hypothetical protein